MPLNFCEIYSPMPHSTLQCHRLINKQFPPPPPVREIRGEEKFGGVSNHRRPLRAILRAVNAYPSLISPTAYSLFHTPRPNLTGPQALDVILGLIPWIDQTLVQVSSNSPGTEKGQVERTWSVKEKAQLQRVGDKSAFSLFAGFRK